jgi:hypothetical protein
LERTNNYKTRAELLAPNERIKDQSSKASSIQQKHPKFRAPNKKIKDQKNKTSNTQQEHPKLSAPNERTRELGASTQSFHTPRRTTKVEF